MHLQIVQGDSFYAQLQWCNQLGKSRDITNITPKVALIDARGNETISFAGNKLDPANGLYEIKQQDTALIPIGYYHLEVVYQAGQLKTHMMPLSVEVVTKRTQTPFRHYKIDAHSGFTKLLLRDSTEQASVEAFEADWSTE